MGFCVRWQGVPRLQPPFPVYCQQERQGPQPGRDGRPGDGGAVLGGEGDGNADRIGGNGYAEPGQERPRSPAAQAVGGHRRGACGPRRSGHGKGGDAGGSVGLRRVDGPGEAAVRGPGRAGLQQGRGTGRRPRSQGRRALEVAASWGCAGSRARWSPGAVCGA